MDPLRLNYIYGGHALEVLRSFPDESVDTCVTSPPYYGLRDYGTEPLIWGGNPECDHEWGTAPIGIGHRAGNKEAVSGFQQHAEVARFGGLAQLGEQRRSSICKCGAWKGHLGGEPTPELYVKNLKDILSEVHRVLKPWGMLCLNIGDSYVGSCQAWGVDTEIMTGIQRHNKGSLHNEGEPVGFRVRGLKSKDLMGMPWRTALAMQGFAVISGADLCGIAELMQYARQNQNWELIEIAEGTIRTWAEVAKIVNPYWLRLDVIWYKKNAMPESVNNRPTSAHEYVFMFVKKADGPMFWRHENGKATSTRPKPDYRWKLRTPIKKKVKRRLEGELLETEREETDHMETPEMPEGWDTDPNVRKAWSRFNLWEGIYYYYDMEAVRQPHQSAERYKYGLKGRSPANGKVSAGSKTGAFNSDQMGDHVSPDGANMRSVWEMCTKSYKGPHYAAFPEELPKRCILASTSGKGNCSKCGKPWVRTMQTHERIGHKSRLDEERFKCGSGHHPSSTKSFVGWHPTCECRRYTCSECAIVIELGDEQTKSNTKAVQLQELRKGVYRYAEGCSESVLREHVQDEMAAGEQEELSIHVQTVQKGVYRRTPPEDEDILQSKVRREVVEGSQHAHSGRKIQRENKKSEGICTSVESRSPEQGGDEIEASLRDGAPISDGAIFGKDSKKRRDGSPQERRQGRQSHRKFGNSHREATQQDGGQGPVKTIPVSTLWWNDKDKSEGVCPKCGGNIRGESFPVSPCLVLDPFCGTGTTLKVATSLGRNFVGIDLNQDYVEKQAKTRTAQRGIHEVGVEPKPTPRTTKKGKSKESRASTRKSFRRDRAPTIPTR
jgi:DNA modification methylase